MHNSIIIEELELQVEFNQQHFPSYTTEECHGTHIMDESFTLTILESCHLRLFGQQVDILPLLTDKQKEKIVNEINERVYE